MKNFSNLFSGFTTKGELNYIGIVDMFFDKITNHVNDDTKRKYLSDFENSIFPCVKSNVPIIEIDEYYLEDLILNIKKKNGFLDTTIASRFRHLVYDPWELCVKEFFGHELDWGIRKEMEMKNDSNTQKISEIVKSFPIEIELEIVEHLMQTPSSITSENLGLLLMLFLGLRCNEACALNYSDIVESKEFPGFSYVNVYKSTQLNSNELKAGGKTNNSIRRVPVIDCLVEYLNKRKEYLSSVIDFPFKINENREITSVEELPIACKSSNFAKRCSTIDLSIAARKLFDSLDLDKSIIVSALKEIEDENNVERNLTAYVFRRNWATRQFTLGMKEIDIALLIGHYVESDTLRRRDSLSEGELFPLFLQMSKHPFNQKTFIESVAFNEYYRADNQLEVMLETQKKSGTLFFDVRANEFNDPIIVESKNAMDIKVIEYNDPILECNAFNITRHLYQKKEE